MKKGKTRELFEWEIVSFLALNMYFETLTTYKTENTEYKPETTSSRYALFSSNSLKIFSFAIKFPNGGKPIIANKDNNTRLPSKGSALIIPVRSENFLIG